MLDTHCHIDLYEHPPAVVAACERDGIYTIAVTNAPSVFQQTEALTAGRRFVRAAIGIHPELAAQRHGELPLMWEGLARTRYVGEVGLDYTLPKSNQAVQRQVFSKVLQKCHDIGDKILTVHSRRAARDVVSAIGPDFRGKVILHWYSGGLKELRRAVGFGFYVSVNPAMALSPRLPTLLAEVPKDRVLLESDGPFVAIEGRPATPQDVGRVVEQISRIWSVPTAKGKEQFRTNFRTLLGPEKAHFGDGQSDHAH